MPHDCKSGQRVSKGRQERNEERRRTPIQGVQMEKYIGAEWS
jgi:hypothetical protein